MCVAFYAILLSCLLSTACKMIKRERERERCKSSAVTVATHQKPNTRCQWSFRSSRGAAQRITCICSKHTHAQPSTETVTLSYTHTDYNLLTHTCIQWDQHLLSHTHIYICTHAHLHREMSPKKPSPTWATCMRAFVCVCLRVCLHCFYLIYVYCTCCCCCLLKLLKIMLA